MTHSIGVVAGHGETIVPGAQQYTVLFDALREEGRPIRRLDGVLDAPKLADCDAILLGGPQRILRESEARALRHWIEAGGHLFVVTERPLVSSPAPSLGSFLRHLWSGCEQPAANHILGVSPELARRRVNDIDSAPLLADRGSLWYDSQTLLAMPAAGLLHALPSRSGEGLALVIVQAGAGRVVVLGSESAFSDKGFARYENATIWSGLVPYWLPGHIAAEVRARQARPQRHRLLHGYPMAPVMPVIDYDDDLGPDPRRGLLVGILPHPFCNPAVKGCGFCTFPHENYSAVKGAAVVAGVVQEIDAAARANPELRRRSIEALYFGGGTANLTPAEPFRDLCRKAAEVFDLSGAEVTLEGVPAYFVHRKPLLLDVLQQEIGARHLRISMGVQTFHEDRLRQMGRLAFGTPATFREAVEAAHSRGFTASADLLFNLPGQTLDQLRDDVRKAIDLGVDHLGLYHLVLFEELGTEWANDPALLAAVPANEQACANWLALRELLLAAGFYQATLTNFERVAHRDTPRRFLYEESAFTPERFDVLGFGPSGFSFVADAKFGEAVKTLNTETSSAYLAAVQAGEQPVERRFDFSRLDLRILYLTRKIARLSIPRAGYRALFQSDPLADFPLEFEELMAAGLLQADADTLHLTPTGMFYADTVAGLLAWRRVQGIKLGRIATERYHRAVAEARREGAGSDGDVNAARRSHMG